MAKYEFTYNKDMKVSISKGNKKVGKNIWTFSLLPGEHEIVTSTVGVLTNVLGTCKGCCDGCENGGCYALRDAKLHHNATIPSWAKNTLIMRNDIDGGFQQLKEACIKNKIKYFRYHASGEIESPKYLEKMVWLANECPDTQFGVYTKRFQWVKEYLGKHGKFPKNLCVNLSKWMDNMDEYMDLKGVNIFGYFDGNDESIVNWHSCPAVAKKPGAKKGYETGVTCDKCLRCYRANGSKTKVYNH